MTLKDDLIISNQFPLEFDNIFWLSSSKHFEKIKQTNCLECITTIFFAMVSNKRSKLSLAQYRKLHTIQHLHINTTNLTFGEICGHFEQTKISNYALCKLPTKIVKHVTVWKHSKTNSKYCFSGCMYYFHTRYKLKQEKPYKLIPSGFDYIKCDVSLWTISNINKLVP